MLAPINVDRWSFGLAFYDFAIFYRRRESESGSLALMPHRHFYLVQFSEYAESARTPSTNAAMRLLSAGLLMFRRRGRGLEVFLVHPGGPFWQNKDIGAWSIPKGEYLKDEDELAAAKREFKEETGVRPEGEFIPLGSITQPGGKVVTAWALEGDCSTAIQSNTFTMEWPPKSGQEREFPEVDRANWFPLPEARGRIHKGQIEFLERLMAHFPR